MSKLVDAIDRINFKDSYIIYYEVKNGKRGERKQFNTSSKQEFENFYNKLKQKAKDGLIEIEEVVD